MYSFGEKRNFSKSKLPEIQAENKKWWNSHPMSYDWNNNFNFEPYTNEWFDEADNLFIHGARLFAHKNKPFERIIPFERIKNKKVLEIGCGIGLHSELLVREGADLTSIDISETSIIATKKRFELRGLEANILNMDAVKLSFPDNYFDFVWSWGVIHHSSETAKIIKEISRVLKKNGESRIMVYNLNGMSAYMVIVKYLIRFWRGKTLDECLWQNTDGFMARYYTFDVLCDIFNLFFKDVTYSTYGQDVDALPLPRKIRSILLKFWDEGKVAKLANQRGGFLFIQAQNKVD